MNQLSIPNGTLTSHLAAACLGQADPAQAAFRWVSPTMNVRTYSYGELDGESGQIANVLASLGIQAGDRGCIFLPRSPELITALFGILKASGIACILFSTFGENALQDRLEDSQPRVLFTRKSLLKRLRPVLEQLSQPEFVLVVDMAEHQSDRILSLPYLLQNASPCFDYPKEVPEETPAFLQYTSGSTGKPKAALHVHGALKAMLASFAEVMQIKSDETYWCTADPAWITGLVYGVFAPLAAQVRQVQFGGSYHAQTWMHLLQEQQVHVWYTAPTAMRMLMQEDEAVFYEHTPRALRRIFCVGEPLNPEVYHWGRRIFECEIYDTWFQSETGSILIANRPGLPVRPGAMGIPVKGIMAFILNNELEPMAVGKQGHLCLQAGWGSMFRTYYHKEHLYREKFQENVYFTGDLAFQDADGYFWYVSRGDDVINTAGHLVGPFEVESALLEIDEIADTAVIGAPDPMLHEKIVAYVRLKPGIDWSRELELKCRIHVSNRVSTTAAPLEYCIIDRIPKNQSGKILRRVLRAWYDGKDPGDISTMEEK